MLLGQKKGITCMRRPTHFEAAHLLTSPGSTSNCPFILACRCQVLQYYNLFFPNGRKMLFHIIKIFRNGTKLYLIFLIFIIQERRCYLPLLTSLLMSTVTIGHNSCGLGNHGFPMLHERLEKNVPLSLVKSLKN